MRQIGRRRLTPASMPATSSKSRLHRRIASPVPASGSSQVPADNSRSIPIPVARRAPMKQPTDPVRRLESGTHAAAGQCRIVRHTDSDLLNIPRISHSGVHCDIFREWAVGVSPGGGGGRGVRLPFRQSLEHRQVGSCDGCLKDIHASGSQYRFIPDFSIYATEKTQILNPGISLGGVMSDACPEGGRSWRRREM